MRFKVSYYANIKYLSTKIPCDTTICDNINIL